MSQRRRYQKKPTATVLAVQIDLETEGFTYQKWGGTQTCKAGDYLVNNAGDVYTVARETFERTYSSVSPGVYVKTERIWAEVAEQDGVIGTQEGETHYRAGDYVVFNEEDDADGWAMEADIFNSLYEPAP